MEEIFSDKRANPKKTKDPDVIKTLGETNLYIPAETEKKGATNLQSVFINPILDDIIKCLEEDNSTWFSNENKLKTLITNALFYLHFNLMGNSNFIYESTTKTQEEQEFQQKSKREIENESSQTSLSLPTRKGKSEFKLFSKLKKTSEVKITKKDFSDPNLIISYLRNCLIDSRQKQALQSNYCQLENYIFDISYCLNTLNRFFLKHKEPVNFHNILTIFFENNGENFGKFTQLENYLYRINWQIMNKNTDSSSDLDKTSFSDDLISILTTFTSHADSLNINFLLSYYKTINYDFKSFKFFNRQIQLIQVAAILCRIVYRILNYYRNSPSSYYIFPADKFKTISSSNTHVTLHNPDGVNKLQDAQQNQQNLKNCFVQDLKEFLSYSIERLDNQVKVINNIAYFYIVNNETGLVLEASKKASADKKSKASNFYLKEKIKSRDEQLWYYYASYGCVVNKVERSDVCMTILNLNPQSPVCLSKNTMGDNSKWYFNNIDNTITSGLSENLALDYKEELLVPESPVSGSPVSAPPVSPSPASSSSSSTNGLAVPPRSLIKILASAQTSSPSLASSNKTENLDIPAPISKEYQVIVSQKEPNKPSQKWTIVFQ